MANWYGAARTNYVRIKDKEAFEAAMADLEVEVVTKGEGANMVFAVLCTTFDGGWPSSTYDADADEDDELDIPGLIAEHMVDGEVLVSMQAGHEKLRYVDGHAEAIHSDGRRLLVTLNDIYELAEKAFGVKPTTATY